MFSSARTRSVTESAVPNLSGCLPMLLRQHLDILNAAGPLGARGRGALHARQGHGIRQQGHGDTQQSGAGGGQLAAGGRHHAARQRWEVGLPAVLTTRIRQIWHQEVTSGGQLAARARHHAARQRWETVIFHSPVSVNDTSLTAGSGWRATSSGKGEIVTSRCVPCMTVVVATEASQRQGTQRWII